MTPHDRVLAAVRAQMTRTELAAVGGVAPATEEQYLRDLIAHLTTRLPHKPQPRPTAAMKPKPDGEVTVVVTRSAGDDGAVVVFVDTTFEPDASDGGPGLRVNVNDGAVFAGVAWTSPDDPDRADRNGEARLEVTLADL